MNEASLFNYKKIINEKGNIYKLLSSSQFPLHLNGDLYISQIKSGEIKAWRKHKTHEVLFIVVSGKVQFKCQYNEKNLIMNKIISLDSCNLIKIKSNIWYGFKGLSNKNSSVLALINGLHSDSEVERMDSDNF